MTWFVAFLAIGAVAWWLVDRAADRRSREKLREMREAFAFLRDYGIECVHEKDDGMGAVIECKGPEIWLNVYYDRGEYSWTFGLVGKPDFNFGPHELCSTSEQAQRFRSKSVREVGAATRDNFPHFVASIRSERAAETVRGRQSTAVERLRAALEEPNL